MDVNAIVQLVGSLGFPIVCACALFWYLNKERESHKEEMDSLNKTIGENTKALIQLQDLVAYLTGAKNHES